MIDNKPFIVFLDYDGVIADMGSRIVAGANTPRHQQFNLVSIGLLKDLQKRYGFLIVCSSRAHAKRTLEEQIDHYPIDMEPFKFHEDYRTSGSLIDGECRMDEYLANTSNYKLEILSGVYGPRSLNSENRGWYILDWLERNGYDPDAGNYMVIDDSTDMFPIPGQSFLHIQEGELLGGFQAKHYIYMLEYLKGMVLLNHLYDTRSYSKVEIDNELPQGVHVTMPKYGVDSVGAMRIVRFRDGAVTVIHSWNGLTKQDRFNFTIHDFFKVNYLISPSDPEK